MVMLDLAATNPLTVLTDGHVNIDTRQKRGWECCGRDCSGHVISLTMILFVHIPITELNYIILGLNAVLTVAVTVFVCHNSLSLETMCGHGHLSCTILVFYLLSKERMVDLATT